MGSHLFSGFFGGDVAHQALLNHMGNLPGDARTQPVPVNSGIAPSLAGAAGGYGTKSLPFANSVMPAAAAVAQAPVGTSGLPVAAAGTAQPSAWGIQPPSGRQVMQTPGRSIYG